jgi:Flp pilus assembly protein TadD
VIFAYGFGVDRVPDQTPSAYAAFQEGMQLLESGSVHAAVVALERARDLEPAQGSIREALGRALFRTGRYDAAREEFERAVELDPVNDYAHFGLGLTLGRLGDRTGARRHLKLAVAMHPRDEYVRALADLGEPPGSAGGA